MRKRTASRECKQNLQRPQISHKMKLADNSGSFSPTDGTIENIRKDTLKVRKADLNIFSRNLAKGNESRNVEKIPAGELCRLLHINRHKNGDDPSDLSSM